MRKSNWYSVDICSKCEHRLTDSELMYSSGTCPHCGHSCRGTVCDYEKVILRSIKHHKWWQIFGIKTTYEGQNEFSKRWLNERQQR
tara:strand:+ start:85 stop:342 length:258 start_codon:yes stop_codon:yes gene_type:complete